MNLIFMITVNMFKKLKLESGYLTCDLQDGKVISDVIAVWATAKYIESGSFTRDQAAFSRLETWLTNFWKIFLVSYETWKYWGEKGPSIGRNRTTLKLFFKVGLFCRVLFSRSYSTGLFRPVLFHRQSRVILDAIDKMKKMHRFKKCYLFNISNYFLQISIDLVEIYRLP